MKPACSFPRISPAPLIDKSLNAILYPLPSSVNSFMDSSLLVAVSVRILDGLYIR